MGARKITQVLCGGVVMLGLGAAQSQATVFNFSGSDEGGTTTAMLDINITGHTVTVTVDNTSPILLDDLSGPNAPGIVGFGFNLNPNGLTLNNWMIEAVDVNNNLVTVGNMVGTATDWEMTSNLANISLDYLPQTTGSIKGALYNPAAMGSPALAAAPNYFTTATLVLEFADSGSPLTLNTDDLYSPFVRMQNVGLGGEGSVKLPGTPDDGPDPGPDPNTAPGTPEPATAMLSVLSLAAVTRGLRRRR